MRNLTIVFIILATASVYHFSFSKPAQMLCKVVRVIAEEVVKSLSLPSPSPCPPPAPPPKKKKRRRRRRRVLWCCRVGLWMDRTKQHATALHRSCKAIHPQECPRINSIVSKVQLSLRWYLSAQKRLCAPHSLSEVSRV